MSLNFKVRRVARRAGMTVLFSAVLSGGLPVAPASPSSAGPSLTAPEKLSAKELAAREAEAAKRAAGWSTEGPDTGETRSPKTPKGANGSHDVVADDRVPPGRAVTDSQPSPGNPPASPPTSDGSKNQQPKRTELTEKRSATSKTWDNGDGTFTTEVAARPVHYQDGAGRWTAYDSTFEPTTGGRLRRKAGDLGVDIAPKASDANLGAVDFGRGRTVSFALTGASAAVAEATGAKATYRAALTGVDVELQARPDGLKETLVLSSSNVPDTFTFPLHLQGLSASLEPDGSVVLRDDGGVVGKIPAGYMEDSAISAEAGVGMVSQGVTYELRGRGRSTTLIVHLDRAWLADPARVFPVRVDPSIEAAWAPAADDTYVYTGGTASVSSTPDLRIGKDPQTGKEHAAYLQFPRLSQELHGTGFKVLDAELALKAVYAPSCAVRGVGIYKVTAGWDGTTMAAYPGAAYDPAVKDWDVYAKGYPGCPDPAGWVYYGPQQPNNTNLKNWVRGWIEDPASNHGLTIRVDQGSEIDPMAFKVFKSWDSDEWPVLKVKWTGYQWETDPALLATWPGCANCPPGFGPFAPGVTPTTAGSVPVWVKNTGADTWYAGSNVKLGYHVAYNGQVCTRSDQPGCFQWDNYHTPLPVTIASGQGAWVTARVDPLPFATYSLFWDMVVEGDQFPWFSDAGISPRGMGGVLSDSAPQIKTAAPADWSQVATTTPTLSVTALDPDGTSSFEFFFEVCSPNGGPCWNSGWQPQTSWSPPANTLSWRTTYLWHANVKSGQTTTITDWRWHVTTHVPQPTTESHLGSDIYSPATGGVNPAIGNYVMSNLDAAVGGAGPAVEVRRTYNSLNPRTGAFGPGWTFPYDITTTTEASGNVIVSYPDGRQQRYGRNPDGSYAGGPGTSGMLVASGGVLQLIDPSGTKQSFTAGQLTAIADPAGRSATLTYQGGLLRTVTNAAARTLTFTWSAGRIVQVDTPTLASTGAPVRWTYAYNTGRLEKVCNATVSTTNCTVYTFDGSTPRITSVTLPSGRRDVALTYNADGTVATRKDGEGATWSWTATTANGLRTSATQTDPLGHTVTFGYDSLGRLISRTNELGKMRTYHYDDLGYMDKETDENGHPVQYVHDAGGNILRRITARLNWGSVGVYYWSSARYWSSPGIDPRNNKITSYLNANAYDETDTAYETTYSYDTLGNLTAENRPWTAECGVGTSCTTTWTWSTGGEAAYGGGTIKPGLLLSYQTPHGGSLNKKWTYEYDAKGDLRRSTDPAGAVTTYTYNELGSLISKAETTDSFPSGLTTTYQFDAYGRLTRSDDPQVTNPVTGVVSGLRSTLTSDADGNVTNEQLQDRIGSGGSRDTSRKLDRSGRVLVETDPTGAVTEYSYDPAGQLSVLVDPLGAVLRSGRDARGLETSTTHVDSASGTNLLTRDLTGNEAATSPWSAGPGTTAAAAGAPNGTATGTIAWAGAQSLSLTGTVSGAIQASVPANLRAPVSAGQTLTAVGYARAATIGRAGTWIGIQWYDTNGALLSTTQGSSTADVTTGWTRIAATGTAPSGAAKAGVIVNVSGVTTSETHRFDGIRLLPGTTRDVTSYTTYDNAGRLATRTDALRRVTGYSYWDDDLLNRVVALDYHEPAGTTPAVRDISLWHCESYDGLGNCVVEYRGSRYTENSYDPAGRLEHIVNGNWESHLYEENGDELREVAFKYDRDNRVTETRLTSTESPGVTETRRASYDALGRVLTTTVVNTGGDLVTRYRNDQRGLPISVTGPRGASLGDTAYTTDTTFDAYGRPSRVTLPLMAVEGSGGVPTNTRSVIDYGYNTFGDQTHARDARGFLTTTTVDIAGRPTRVDLPTYTRPDSTTLTPFSTTTYNAKGLPTLSVDPRGNSTSYAYDTAGRLVTRTDPQATGQPGPAVWRFSHDDIGNVVSRTNPAGGVTNVVYDDLNRVRNSTDVERYGTAGSFTMAYSYNDANDLTKIISPAGETTVIGVNNFGETVSVKDPTNQTSTVTRDLAGRVVKVTDPMGRATKSTYDLAGRLTTTRDLAVGGAELRRTTFGYDADGNRTSIISPLGWVTTLGFDAASRLTSQVEPVSAIPADSITTTFGYDGNGNRTRVTDGANHSTITTYNPWNLPATVAEPPTTAHPNSAQRTWTATYDAGGQPVRLDGPGGVSRIRTFDELGRLTTETGSGAEAATTSRSLGYDLLGRLTSESTPTGNETFAWNDRGQTLTANGPAGGASFAYDANGRMTSRTDAAGTASFTWTPRSELKTATDPLTGATRTYTYNPGGDLTDIDFGAGKAHQTITRNDLRQPTSDSLKTAGGTTIASTAWTWDNDDNLLSRTTGPAGIAGAGTTSYSYDRAHRLSSATATTGLTSLYEWDKAGNRTRVGVGRATYDERNRQLSQTNGTDVTPVFTEDWTGTTAAGWNPTKWVTTSNDSSKKADIQDNQGELYVNGAPARATAQMTAVSNLEARFTYRFSDRNATSFLRVSLRASGATGSSQMPNAYRLEIASDSSTIKLQKFVNSTVTQIGSFAYTQDTNGQRVRFRVQGNTIQAKVWPVGGTEPAAWSVVATDTAVSVAGVVQLAHSHTSGARSVYIDELNFVDPTAADSAATNLTTTTSSWTPRGTLLSRTTGANSQAMTFDAFDRLISDTTTTYAYDSLDRLAQRNAGIFSYAGTEKEPVSDGSQLFARDPNGDPLALRAGATNLAVRRDLIHGDLTATFSPSGITTTDSRAYDPFGAVIAATGTTNPALGYQAQWTDPATNKVDMQARWYDPAMGAFPSRDTWASPDLPSNAMNRMAYAGSNPLRYSDPSGHCFEVFSCALVGLAVGAVVIYVAVAPALEPGTNQQTPSTTPTTRYQPPAPTIPDEPFEDLPQAPTYRPAPVIAPPAVQTQTQVQAPKPTQKQNTTSNQTVVKKPVNNSNSQKQNTNNTTSQTHRTTVIQAPKPVEVPAANLIAGAPPAFSAWKNPLDVDPLAGVIIHQAVNQAVTYTPPGEGPQYVGDAAPESAPNVTGERRTILTTPPFDPGRATLPTPAISGSGLTVLRSVDDPMAPGDGSAAERRSPGQPVPAPKELDAFPDAQWAKPKTPVQGGGGLRPRWKDSDGRIYEWDRQHGTVEVYNKRGRHLGEFDPKTGEQVKPNDPGRRIEP